MRWLGFVSHLVFLVLPRNKTKENTKKRQENELKELQINVLEDAQGLYPIQEAKL